jgi:hypothetical protein
MAHERAGRAPSMIESPGYLQLICDDFVCSCGSGGCLRGSAAFRGCLTGLRAARGLVSEARRFLDDAYRNDGLRLFGLSESEGRFLRYVNSIRPKCLEGCASTRDGCGAGDGGLMTSGQGCRRRAVSISKARTAVHISHSWKPHDANEACL